MPEFANKSFHELWTEAVGLPHYNKEPWNRLTDRQCAVHMTLQASDLSLAVETEAEREKERIMSAAVALFLEQSKSRVVAEAPEGSRAA